MAYYRQPFAFYWTCVAIIQPSKLKKYEQSTIFWPHRTTIECVGQCCVAQELHSVAQNKVWNYMNHPLINSTNTNKIWKESWGRAWSMLVFQWPDLQTFLNDCIHCELHYYNTADADDLATQRTRSSPSIVLNHSTRNILISTQETLIFWENGLFKGSVLQWRHNEGDGVSTYQPHDCLLNRLFRCRSNQTSKLRVSGLCEGNSPLTGRFGYKQISSEAWFDLQPKFPYRNHSFLNTFRGILSHHVWYFPPSLSQWIHL